MVDQDGVLVNVHAEKDRLGEALIVAEQHQAAAECTYMGVRAKVWLKYKSDEESKNKKVALGVLDKMVERDQDNPKSEVCGAWQAKVDAEAVAKRAAQLFWNMKTLVDIDVKRMV